MPLGWRIFWHIPEWIHTLLWRISGKRLMHITDLDTGLHSGWYWMTDSEWSQLTKMVAL